MLSRKRSRVDYLFRRGETWWIKFQYPPVLHATHGKKKEQSLRTKDRREAEAIAGPMIAEHKKLVWEQQNKRARRIRVAGFQYRYELGDRVLENGTRQIATETTALLIRDGVILKEESNELLIVPTFDFDPIFVSGRARAAKRDNSSLDETVFETWKSLNAVDPRVEADARRVFALFKDITGNKSFAEADRGDGRKVAEALFAEGKKSATVQKLTGYLRSMVNIAIDDKKLQFNPFSKIVKQIDDARDRLPLDDSDMAKVRARIHELEPEDRVLWTWLASTGMRRGEPFQVREEFQEADIRYVFVGSKTEASERRLPIPNSVLPLLPDRICGPVFSDLERNHGRRLNRFLRRVGVTDKRKVLHSLRHRAKDRLRLLGCPHDIQLSILGHEVRTVSDDYGKGYPMRVLKHWIDQIEC